MSLSLNRNPKNRKTVPPGSNSKKTLGFPNKPIADPSIIGKRASYGVQNYREDSHSHGIGINSGLEGITQLALETLDDYRLVQGRCKVCDDQANR